MNMTLDERRADVEARYDKLMLQKQDIVKQGETIEVELLKLQGEHRLIQELINNRDQIKASKAEGVTDAATGSTTDESAS